MGDSDKNTSQYLPHASNYCQVVVELLTMVAAEVMEALLHAEEVIMDQFWAMQRSISHVSAAVLTRT